MRLAGVWRAGVRVGIPHYSAHLSIGWAVSSDYAVGCSTLPSSSPTTSVGSGDISTFVSRTSCPHVSQIAIFFFV